MSSTETLTFGPEWLVTYHISLDGFFCDYQVLFRTSNLYLYVMYFKLSMKIKFMDIFKLLIKIYNIYLWFDFH